MIKHDLENGHQEKCQICGNSDLKTVIDLGSQPLSDKLLKLNQGLKSEMIYPLIQVRCPECSLNQLSYICPAETLFGDDYSYKTGVTEELVSYQAGMAADLVTELGLSSKALVCDIGSNDGTLLKGFIKQGVKVIGVEPTDVADIANDQGVPTLRMPFGEAAANKVVNLHGKVLLATSTNVFAHVQRLGDFIRGLDTMLDDNGWFCFENHYLVDILDSSQFDTIYHEHLRSLSLHAIVALFKQYEFSITKASRTSRYGGNIRVLVQKGNHQPFDDSVQNILKNEMEIGVFDSKTYERFRESSISAKMGLMKLLIDLRQKGKSVVGYSLPARAVTLINYYGIDHDLISYVVEQPASLKLDRFVPGTRMPVYCNTRLEGDMPDYLVIFAWHLKDEIISHLRNRGLKGKCIIPLPTVNIIDL